ncbi:PepSY-associated TM helix domain-containing protein [Aureimonas sp. ME7]|uniref:PepSY-associated TM helix domain-containing protein n=1 Tax=Aureimonas sp. ME7 TaxID=2744252 RepID=UPI0015F436CD|nr:PepSY-associated TM helix domain-containing protein [Aureimonas sp. ME7]
MRDPTPHRSGPSIAASARPNGSIRAFVARLHFYAGLFVGPFILIAALTGTLYVVTPQIEASLYREVLHTNSQGNPASLAAQVEAAQLHMATAESPRAVRPAPHPGDVSRIMFAAPDLGPSEYRTVFVDPFTLRITGDLVTYGTSGILPFRTTLDYLHRSLMLGELGRAYSELAASWLWILALGGLCLFLWRNTGRMRSRKPDHAAIRLRHRHGLTGVVLLVGLVFISATGLTWSEWAGARISDARSAFGWVTPPLNLSLGSAPPIAEHDGHAHHDGHGSAMTAMPTMADPARSIDDVLRAARAAGIDSPMVEIGFPTETQAWAVREYDRSWPTQVDAVAVHPETLDIMSRSDFATFPWVAKLIRWGIDAHMGVLFGPVNQFILAGFGIALCITVIYGYRIWWNQRPPADAFPRTLMLVWLQLSPVAKAVCLASGAFLGWCLPMLGISLAVFVAIDGLRWYGARKGQNFADA